MHDSVPLDLCSECRFAGLCVYCTLDREPVLTCTGFDRLEGSQRDAVEKAVGLCANCNLSSTCTQDRPASGIWHCEDYC